jgi:hypothetical protein
MQLQSDPNWRPFVDMGSFFALLLLGAVFGLPVGVVIGFVSVKIIERMYPNKYYYIIGHITIVRNAEMIYHFQNKKYAKLFNELNKIN